MPTDLGILLLRLARKVVFHTAEAKRFESGRTANEVAHHRHDASAVAFRAAMLTVAEVNGHSGTAAARLIEDALRQVA